MNLPTTSHSRLLVFVSLSGNLAPGCGKMMWKSAELTCHVLCFSRSSLLCEMFSTMKRFTSPRSSSLDDVRTERAAIALSVGLSWPPAKRQRSAGRSTFQEAWERAVHEHILQFHELPDRACHRAAWWRPGQPIVRPLTADVIGSVSTLSAAVCVAFAPSTSDAKRRKVHVNAVMRDWFLDVYDAWKGERRWDMQTAHV